MSTAIRFTAWVFFLAAMFVAWDAPSHDLPAAVGLIAAGLAFSVQPFHRQSD